MIKEGLKKNRMVTNHTQHVSRTQLAERVCGIMAPTALRLRVEIEWWWVRLLHRSMSLLLECAVLWEESMSLSLAVHSIIISSTSSNDVVRRNRTGRPRRWREQEEEEGGSGSWW